jgi:hypothetical protein
MVWRVSISPAPAPARADSLLRLPLGDGCVTTAHVARWDLTRTRVSVTRLATQQRVVDWCAATGCADAVVGGFYTRPEGSPLGELRLAGQAVPHVAFTAPWHTLRASLHVDGAAVRIDHRERLSADAGDLLQAGPLLVRGGELVYRDGVDSEGFSAANGQFDSDITEGRHPRAAIGLTDREVFALVADGRSDEDAGLTLEELATAMADLGAIAAMNLDGGGSASLVCDGRLRNRPRESHGVGLAGGRAVTTLIAFDAD